MSPLARVIASVVALLPGACGDDTPQPMLNEEQLENFAGVPPHSHEVAPDGNRPAPAEPKP